MNAIIAINKLGYIGKDNKLLWRNLNDLNHFKTLTHGQVCLAGWNTYNSLPILRNRVIVLDNRHELVDISSVDWCIGGKKTYEKYSPFFTELHISHIDDYSIGDTTEPNWDNLNKNCKIFYYNF